MSDLKSIPLKFAILMLIPQIAVTIGGIMVYGSASAFFGTPADVATRSATSPAAIYYGMSVVISLMFFLMRQGLAGYEFVAYGAASLIFSFLMKRLTPLLSNSLISYLLPMLLFYTLIWLILKFIFLNPPLRQMRLLLFALLSAVAFSLAFWVQYHLLKQTLEPGFFQGRFISGVFFMVFLGFGFSMAELALSKIVHSTKDSRRPPDLDNDTASEEDDEND